MKRLAAILLAYALLAAAVQVHCADLLSSDGECYLRMAAYYAKGDFRHAVFGHWSPLGTWLTVPLAWAGLESRVAFRLMIALWGAAAVVGAWRLAGRLGMGPALRTAATACAALLVAEFSAEHRVDLLLAALLLFYLDAAMDERLLRLPIANCRLPNEKTERCQPCLLPGMQSEEQNRLDRERRENTRKERGEVFGSGPNRPPRLVLFRVLSRVSRFISLPPQIGNRKSEISWWPLWVGVLGGMAYLAKLYALPFFGIHFTLVIAARAWGNASRQEEDGRRHEADGARLDKPAVALSAGRAWIVGIGGFALVAAPWVAVLSARYGRLTLGTAGATTYARYGPGSGEARWQAIAGLRKPPADAYNVWQDATLEATGPAAKAPSPLAGPQALWQQLRFAGRNARLILGHLAALDEFRLGLVALVLTPLAAAATWRRRQSAFRYLAVGLAVLIFCGGYAVIFAEDMRFFWFPLLVLTVLVFHFAEELPRALARWLGETRRRRLAVAVGVVVAVSFAFHPVRALGVLFQGPPPGVEHRWAAAVLAQWGVTGPLASLGERAWWNGLHTAYYLDEKYAGTPRAETARGVAAEMREAGAAALLVWGDPRWARSLRAEPALAWVGTIRAGSLPGFGGDVAVFRLQRASP